ncbi:MAG TPA: aminoglycoside phosphotransferase family protein [Anaerolineales bacterium]|nr:aminoglycoside phosphotransferase family protein [Anaerolineales bacterium]
MDEITSSGQPGSENPDSLESIADSIFSRHGIDFSAGQQAGGWTNAVWMTEELVLRLSTQKERKNLLYEARLSAFLPSEVGYPQTVETGTTAGHAWTLAKKLPGTSLGEAWDDLQCEERVIALQGLWARAQAVHSVPCEDIATIVSGRAWFNSTNPEEAEASLTRLTQEGIFTPTETSGLQDALSHFWGVLPSAPCVLCHGDLTMNNSMWHDGQVTALLDFEFAVLAPAQLDLNHLVKKAFGPDDAVTDVHEAQQLRQAVKKLALPILTQPGSKALLVGYAILLELWLLEEWLAHPEGEGPLEQWDPLRRLRLLADGRGGYLAPLLPG